MNLIFRLIYTLIITRFRTSCSPLGPCETHFRCLPTDIDVLMHINNGKYFSMMDIARVDLMGRSKMLKKFSSYGWYPVVVAETITFYKSIKLFQSFTIKTSVIGWDEKAVLLKQQFYCKGALYTEAVVRSRFLKKTGGSVTSEELLKALNLNQSSPQLPDWLNTWNQQQTK